MTIEDYLNDVPASRYERVTQILKLIESTYPTAERSMKYKMPTYSLDSGWVAVGNQKSYVSVYTCDAKILEPFKLKHPEIKTGKGCINFRDNDDIPLDALRIVIRNAMEGRL